MIRDSTCKESEEITRAPEGTNTSGLTRRSVDLLERLESHSGEPLRIAYEFREQLHGMQDGT